MGRTISTIINSDKRVFKVGSLDDHRNVKRISLRTVPMAGIYIDCPSYLIEMETEDKKINYGLIPHKDVVYLEFIDDTEEKKEKPLELRMAAAAGEPDGEA